MAIDVTALIVISLFFIRGYSRGLIVGLLSAVAILLGILCALKLSQALSSWLLAKGYTTMVWAPFVSYILLFVGVVILVRSLARLLQKVAEGLMLGLANRIAGGMIYAFVGAILFSSLLWMTEKAGAINANTIDASITYPFFSSLAPWFFSAIGHLLPFAKEVFDRLKAFYDAIQPA